MDLVALNELAAQQAAARQAARDFAACTKEVFGNRLEWVRLYGSLARGDWLGPDESDIDVALVLREKTDSDVNRIIQLASAQLLKSGFVFSPRVFKPEEFKELIHRELRLGYDILNEGETL